VPNRYLKCRKTLKDNEAHPAWETHARKYQPLKLLLNLPTTMDEFADKQSNLLSAQGVPAKRVDRLSPQGQGHLTARSRKPRQRALDLCREFITDEWFLNDLILSDILERGFVCIPSYEQDRQ
jgi:hypothetical protein